MTIGCTTVVASLFGGATGRAGIQPGVSTPRTLATTAAQPPASAQQAPPDVLQEADPDVHFTVRWLTYNGQYELRIESLTRLGTVTALNWTPPPSLRVVSVTRSQGGSCGVSPTGGISCETRLLPSSCRGDTCYPANTAITVDFTAALTGNPPGSSFTDLFWGSYLDVTAMNLLPAPYSDFPLCPKGHLSTKAHPCSPR